MSDHYADIRAAVEEIVSEWLITRGVDYGDLVQTLSNWVIDTYGPPF